MVRRSEFSRKERRCFIVEDDFGLGIRDDLPKALRGGTPIERDIGCVRLEYAENGDKRMNGFREAK